MELAEAIEGIRTGPQGPQVGAFFDYDGTLIHGFSGVPFFRKVFHKSEMSRRELAATLLAHLRGEKTDHDMELFSARALRAWSGHTEAELAEIGARLFQRKIAGHVYPEAWQLIQAHAAAGHTLVIATSASRFQVEAAAATLGIPHVLCTTMEVNAGRLTGRVAGKMLWRNEKAAAVRDFADTHQIVLPDSYAYSNGGEDEPFLALAGHPLAVNPDQRLRVAAVAQHWPTLRFQPRGAPGVAELSRTAGGFAGLLGGVAAGLARRGDRRERVDAVISRGAAGALAGAGVDLAISGAEHAAAPRPAVFIFNHQSEFDMVVIAGVLRGGVTAIAKRELLRTPVFGALLRYAGVTFIDRSDPDAARAALGPVVDTLRSGLSVVIAPEGTRSLTPSVGEFKKGAFHLAMEASVPVIPIVIRNAGEIYWRHAKVIRPGRIDVAVLEPIDVSGWDRDNLSAHIALVRQLYIDTLTHWPAG